MKDLRSIHYWARFGDLGFAMGKSNMPTPREVADTVLGLMGERRAETARADYAEGQLRILKQQVTTLLLKFVNEADDLRYHVQGSNPGQGNALHPTAAQDLTGERNG